MNSRSSIGLLAALVLGCTPPRPVQDPIAELTARLRGQEFMPSEMDSPIRLPATAEPGQVVTELFKRRGAVSVPVDRHKILAVREVCLARAATKDFVDGAQYERYRNSMTYTAALVDTDLGQKIVLFKHVSLTNGWWIRVFDVL